jgi:hypothetical protein
VFGRLKTKWPRICAGLLTNLALREALRLSGRTNPIYQMTSSHIAQHHCGLRRYCGKRVCPHVGIGERAGTRSICMLERSMGRIDRAFRKRESVAGHAIRDSVGDVGRLVPDRDSNQKLATIADGRRADIGTISVGHERPNLPIRLRPGLPNHAVRNVCELRLMVDRHQRTIRHDERPSGIFRAASDPQHSRGRPRPSGHRARRRVLISALPSQPLDAHRKP